WRIPPPCERGTLILAHVGSAAPGAGGLLPFHPHYEVWALVAGVLAAYVVALRPLGPRVAPLRGVDEPVVETTHRVRFGLALLLVWVFADWPIHDIAERYLFFVHMVQHTVFSMIAPPIMLLGLPAWLLDWLTSPRWLRVVLRRLCRPLPAALL